MITLQTGFIGEREVIATEKGIRFIEANRGLEDFVKKIEACEIPYLAFGSSGDAFIFGDAVLKRYAWNNDHGSSQFFALIQAKEIYGWLFDVPDPYFANAQYLATERVVRESVLSFLRQNPGQTERVLGTLAEIVNIVVADGKLELDAIEATRYFRQILKKETRGEYEPNVFVARGGKDYRFTFIDVNLKRPEAEGELRYRHHDSLVRDGPGNLV